MRKKSIPALAACLLAGICALRAQELAVPPADRMESAHRKPSSAVRPSACPIPWQREQTDPILGQRRAIGAIMTQRTQRSVWLRSGSATSAPDPNREIARWRATIGNAAVSNWSPYPDRALDARTLRFPLPRNTRPGKSR